MVLIIDNYDSFTYNLVQYLATLGAPVEVVRNDAINIAAITALRPDHILISPGPGTPKQSGISLAVIETFANQIPILGVCLGHEAIAHFYGAQVIHAKRVMHGKVSTLYHANRGVFHNLPSPYQITRYHSLIVDYHSLPDCLEVTAWTADPTGNMEIMAIKHKRFQVEGIQFHPEAILTEYGYELLQNFLNQSTK